MPAWGLDPTTKKQNDSKARCYNHAAIYSHTEKRVHNGSYIFQLITRMDRLAFATIVIRVNSAASGRNATFLTRLKITFSAWSRDKSKSNLKYFLNSEFTLAV